MTAISFHPATLQLLRLQSRGRRRRMWQRFCQPRRLVLSAIACLLGVLWLGNAAMTIWLRETASPATLRAMLSLGFVLYAGWHVAKAAFFRPESPLDWTPSEREILAAMPLQPHDLVAYQLASVTLTTIVKAGLFTLLLWPDLRCVPLGLSGVLLAMMMLEMLRMGIEIATWGMSRAAFLTYRAVTVAGLLFTGFTSGAVIVQHVGLARDISADQGLFLRLVKILMEPNGSVLGGFALPFQPLVDLILADRITAGNVWLVMAALAAVTGMAACVIGLYAVTSRRNAFQERRNYLMGTKGRVHGHSDHERMARSRPLPVIPRWGGVGPIAWRQLLGARRRSGSLLTAMIAPAILAGAPCLTIADANLAVLATAGTLAFYTFLLLPTALRFDFRRDLDRLATLKGLPIAPAAAVAGQTLAPVLIATLFQTVVLAFAIVARSLPAYHLVVAMLVMVPLNVLVFGLDNLIYLLYPYRVQQEGLEIFLRTMLTFTGKGLLFCIGLVAVSVWGFAAAAVSKQIAIGSSVLFITGLIAGVSVLAALVLCGLCRTYGNMNSIEDVPR